MKIAFFGDSLTQGTLGVSYVDKIARTLRGHHFYNCGVNGDTSLNLYRRVDQDVIALNPEAVLVMIGINDAISHVEPTSRWYYTLVKRIPGGTISPIAFRENMRAVLTRLQHKNIMTWVALPPIEYRPAQVETLRKMNTEAAHLCAEMNIPTVNLMNELTPKDIPERTPLNYQNYLNNLRLILGSRPYEKMRAAGGFSYTFDGIHLTDDGAQRIADQLITFLQAQGINQ